MYLCIYVYCNVLNFLGVFLNEQKMKEGENVELKKKKTEKSDYMQEYDFSLINLIDPFMDTYPQIELN